MNYITKRAITKLKRLKSRLLGIGTEFRGSEAYWRLRYEMGGNSGGGSYGKLAHYKADFINSLVAEKQINSVVEFGCGDGNQLTLAKYPAYLGLDVAPRSIALCRKRFARDATKRFETLPYQLETLFDLALSLDVIYHLVEDEVYEGHLSALFKAANKCVVIYSSNCEADSVVPHVKHRKFMTWISQNIVGWDLAQHLPNRYPSEAAYCGPGLEAEFFVFVRNACCPPAYDVD